MAISPGIAGRRSEADLFKSTQHCGAAVSPGVLEAFLFPNMVRQKNSGSSRGLFRTSQGALCEVGVAETVSTVALGVCIRCNCYCQITAE